MLISRTYTAFKVGEKTSILLFSCDVSAKTFSFLMPEKKGQLILLEKPKRQLIRLKKRRS